MGKNRCDAELREDVFVELRDAKDTNNARNFLYLMAKADYGDYKKVVSAGLGGGVMGPLDLDGDGLLDFHAHFSPEQFKNWRTGVHEKLTPSQSEEMKATTHKRVASPPIIEAWLKCMGLKERSGVFLDYDLEGEKTVFVSLVWVPSPGETAAPTVMSSFVSGGTGREPGVSGNGLFPEGTPLKPNGIISARLERIESKPISVLVNLSSGHNLKADIPLPRKPRTANAAADFTPNSNGGIWTYGYRTTLESDFIAYVENRAFGVGLNWWGEDMSSGAPSIACNSASPVVEYGGVIQHPRNMLNLHPGPRGEFCVLRWTAPADGDYGIELAYQGLNFAAGTTSNLIVLHNASIIVSSIDVNGFGQPSAGQVKKDATVDLGDTIDFCVGWGANNSFDSDSTGLDVRIAAL